MAGKGGKGLLAGKTTAAAAAAAANKEKDKKRPVSRSSRAGLQVIFVSSSYIKRFGFYSFSVEGFHRRCKLKLKLVESLYSFSHSGCLFCFVMLFFVLKIVLLHIFSMDNRKNSASSVCQHGSSTKTSANVSRLECLFCFIILVYVYFLLILI
nr:uncharacterized protein LOC104096482 isoform X1 [Nicotiana tomentosiformis]